MHTFSVRNIAVMTISTAIVGISLALIFGTGLREVRSGSGDNVSGFAWSETIGWISMNSTGESSITSDYGVNVAADGTISGFAWSENIGWISFNESGCPSGSCTPTLNKTTGAVSGWARALSAPSAGLNSGGWDGWISLKGISTDGNEYGVTVTGCNWGGWAWGSDVVGWVNFSGNGGTVVGTGDACQAAVPACTGTTPTNATQCSVGLISSDTPYRAVPSGFSCVNKCDYRCDSGYIENSTLTDCRPTQCNDNIDQDSDGTLDFDGNGNLANIAPGCLDSNGNPNINDDTESMSVTDPTINARPRVVSQGGNTTLEWSSGGVLESSCTVTANTQNISAAAFAGDTNASTFNGSYQTLVNVRTTYTITCGARSDSVTVEVQGYGTET